MKYERIEDYIKNPIKNDHIESINIEIFYTEKYLSSFIFRQIFILFLYFCFLSALLSYVYLSSFDIFQKSFLCFLSTVLFLKTVYNSLKEFIIVEKESVKSLKTQCKIEIKNSDGCFYDYLSDLSNYEFKSLKKLMMPVSKNKALSDSTDSGFQDPLYEDFKLNVSGLDREVLMFEYYMLKNN